jgi:putative tricarboxylic transport membrane protein
VRPLLWILLVPRERLMPVVFVLCVVGSYAITSRVFDIYVMLFFGFLGFILRDLKFPMAPLILGLVLGDLLEKNLTRGLVLSGGSVAPFFTRPISGGIAAITAFSILWSIPAVNERVRGVFRRAPRAPAGVA